MSGPGVSALPARRVFISQTKHNVITMNPLITQTQALKHALQKALLMAPMSEIVDALNHIDGALTALQRLPEPQYRLLAAGEIIAEHDEVLDDDGTWVASYLREPVCQGSVGKYRRPIRAAHARR
jgi:hypothetical protein